MAEHNHASLLAAEFRNHGGETFANAPETQFASGLFGFKLRGQAALFERAFGSNDDTEMFTQTLTHHDGLDNLCRIVGNFGNEDNVRAAGDSGVYGNPAGVPSHHLDDNDPTM